MRKSYLLALAFLLPHLAFSQTYIGVKGGMNFCWYSGDAWERHLLAAEEDTGLDVTDSAVPIGGLGIFIDAMLTEHIGVYSSIGFNAYGVNCVIANINALRMEYRQNVIEVPLLLKFTTSTYIRGGVYVVIGPMIQYLFRDYEMKGLYYDEIWSDYLEPPDNLFIVSILGGFGVEAPSDSGLFKAEVTYGRNLTQPSDTIDFPYDVINNIQVTLCYGSKL